MSSLLLQSLEMMKKWLPCQMIKVSRCAIGWRAFGYRAVGGVFEHVTRCIILIIWELNEYEHYLFSNLPKYVESTFGVVSLYLFFC